MKIERSRIAKVTETDRYFYHKDHLGSSTVMTDKDALEIEYSDYLHSVISASTPEHRSPITGSPTRNMMAHPGFTIMMRGFTIW